MYYGYEGNPYGVGTLNGIQWEAEAKWDEEQKKKAAKCAANKARLEKKRNAELKRETVRSSLKGENKK